MAFEKLSSRRVRTANVSIGLYTKRNNNTKQLTVGLRNHIMEELGWGDQEKIDFLWGTGEDKGHLKLVQREDGYEPGRTSVDGKNYIVAVVPKGTRDEKIPLTECDYEIEGKSLVIVLPESFYKD